MDDRGALDLAVVGLVADLLDLDLPAQPRQQLLAKRIACASRKVRLSSSPMLALVPAAQVVLLLVVEHERVEQRALRRRDGGRRACPRVSESA